MYRIIPEKSERIKKRYKIITMAEETGMSCSLISQVINGKIGCSKKNAYCITKWIDQEAEIEDFFIRSDEVE